MSGGESGVIFQDQAIRRMTYLPGSPVIFQIEVIARDNGLSAPLSLIRAGERTFFYSSQGFQVILPGQYPTPIGREKVDRTTLADVDKANLKYFIGASDPRNTRVFWAYKSVSGAVGGFDKLLCYDWVLDKFTPISVSGEYLFPVTQPGLTLEGLDALSGSLEPRAPIECRAPLERRASLERRDCGARVGNRDDGLGAGAGRSAGRPQPAADRRLADGDRGWDAPPGRPPRPIAKRAWLRSRPLP